MPHSAAGQFTHILSQDPPSYPISIVILLLQRGSERFVKLDHGHIPGKWKSRDLNWECLALTPMHCILIMTVEQCKCLARGHLVNYDTSTILTIISHKNSVFEDLFNDIGNTLDMKLSENDKILQWMLIVAPKIYIFA